MPRYYEWLNIEFQIANYEIPKCGAFANMQESWSYNNPQPTDYVTKVSNTITAKVANNTLQSCQTCTTKVVNYIVNFSNSLQDYRLHNKGIRHNITIDYIIMCISAIILQRSQALYHKDYLTHSL